jgi:hypothetical protein
MEFNGLLVLAVLWFLLNLITKAGRKSQTPRDPTLPEPVRPRPLPTSPDATQQEGSRLEQMLRQLERSLEEVAQTDHPMRIPLPPAEEVEDRESLEVEPEVRSLEGEVHREARRLVDQDDEAADIETRRIQAAASRDAALTKVDHAAFDQRIRQEPADHTASRTYTTQQLRDAMVWREILGPPVSLRDSERR